MKKEIELVHTSLGCLEQHIKSPDNIPIPRTSLSIAASVFSVFPETKNPENLNKIGNISPLMIALNEAADIGISAEKRIIKGNLDQPRLWGLLLLKGQLFGNLEKRINEFREKYPNKEIFVIKFIKDFLLLSKERNKFPIKDWPAFLELDSAIFVAAYVGIIAPEILEKAGLYMEEQVETMEELKKKYSIFLINQNNQDEFSDIQKRLRSLFASVMILKITDDQNDKNGSNVDKILDLPNFWDFAVNQDPEKPEEVLKQIRKKYEETASLAFPKFYQISADILCKFTSIHKARKSTNGILPEDDPTSVGRFFQKESQTTTLRHELAAAQIIQELFR